MSKKKLKIKAAKIHTGSIVINAADGKGEKT